MCVRRVFWWQCSTQLEQPLWMLSEPLRGDGQWLISVLWLKRGHLTAAVTVGGTSQSTQGDRRVPGVFISPASLYPKGKRQGS